MELPKRKSPRIPNYDYCTPNYYFITICTHNKANIFGKPDGLSLYGRIASEHMERIPQIYPHIRLDKYVVMPNHVHAILIVSTGHAESVQSDLTQVIGQYKMSVTKRIRQHGEHIQVWQRSFHDHIIRNQRSYEKIWLYIENNPQKWEEDCFYMERC